MSSAIYCRLAGQAVTLVVHSVNCVTMLLATQNEELLKDPDLKTMTSMQSRYLTVWNIAFQIAYFSLAFACDILTVTGRDHMIPKGIRQLRHTYFSGILWPVTSLIFVFFWPVFLTNRELLFPSFIDKMFSFKSNLVMHFWILPAALWELVFWPRLAPKSHAISIGLVTAIFIIYNAIIIHTYNERGLWPYPFLHQLYDTVYYIPFLSAIYVMGLAIYYSQWKITAMVWGKEMKNGEKKVK